MMVPSLPGKPIKYNFSKSHRKVRYKITITYETLPGLAGRADLY